MNSDATTPAPDEAEYCIELRKKSKRGVRLHADDRAFVDRMYRDFPEWYRATERRIFVETAPYGSQPEEMNNQQEDTDNE